jgi:hypothetical protein
VKKSYLKIAVFGFSFFCLFLTAAAGIAQTKQFDDSGNHSYDVSFAPDLWFNSTDGFRVGIRMKGKEPGTFQKGPHRLDVGLWLGTFIPKYPVSYYVSLTEPIRSISGFNSEANVKLRSSFRTGFMVHGISLKKRWQPGFNEKDYRVLKVLFRAEKRIDDEYLLYPQIWQPHWLYIAGLNYSMKNGNPIGRYSLNSSTVVNVAGKNQPFIQTRLNAQQVVPLGSGFSINGRIFVGLASKNTAPEYLFTRSLEPYRRWMRLGTTRARGTIPVAWMHEGFIQIEGGPDLRGYTGEDIDRLNHGFAPEYTSFGALNLELKYPNPIGSALENVPFVGGLLKFSSYLFFDSGTSLGLTKREESRLLSDFGPGFQLTLNIPDYLGKSRGFAIRYDIPLWVSNPANGEPVFKYRSLVGIGAVISFSL